MNFIFSAHEECIHQPRVIYKYEKYLLFYNEKYDYFKSWNMHISRSVYLILITYSQRKILLTSFLIEYEVRSRVSSWPDWKGLIEACQQNQDVALRTTEYRAFFLFCQCFFGTYHTLPLGFLLLCFHGCPIPVLMSIFFLEIS